MTSEWHGEHLFIGLNTQQLVEFCMTNIALYLSRSNQKNTWVHALAFAGIFSWGFSWTVKGPKINLNCIRYPDKTPKKTYFKFLGASEPIDPLPLLNPHGFMRLKFQFGRFTWVMCILIKQTGNLQAVGRSKSSFLAFKHLFHQIKEKR